MASLYRVRYIEIPAHCATGKVCDSNNWNNPVSHRTVNCLNHKSLFARIDAAQHVIRRFLELDRCHLRVDAPICSGASVHMFFDTRVTLRHRGSAASMTAGHRCDTAGMQSSRLQGAALTLLPPPIYTHGVSIDIPNRKERERVLPKTARCTFF